MWATLALTTALQLAPAQTEALALKNVRATYGVLGQERKDSRLLPGDIYVVAFDIENLRVKEDGRVLYSMGVELTNKDDKPVFKTEPRDLEIVNTLGGTRLPAFARAVIGLDTPPGAYTFKVTVTDRAAKKTEILTRKFEVLPLKFGFVRLAVTYETGQDAPPVAVPGQALMLNFTLVGFELDKKKQQPNVAVEMRILDEAGKPTLAKPFTASLQEVEEQYKDYKKAFPLQNPLNINRAGKFKIMIKATDKIGNKTVEQELDLTALEVK
jgi:hypothetical protein